MGMLSTYGHKKETVLGGRYLAVWIAKVEFGRCELQIRNWKTDGFLVLCVVKIQSYLPKLHKKCKNMQKNV
jgi:hypothetical protein